MKYAAASEAAARLHGSVLALGRGGLAHWIVRLFIWQEIWRFMRFIWLIPTFGPFIVVLIVAVIVGFIIWQQQHRQRRRAGLGTGPRDW